MQNKTNNTINIKRLLSSFGYAWRGLWYCLRYERHFRVHLVFAAYTLFFAPSFSLSRGEWGVLFLAIAAVIASEAVNTSVERAVDLSSENPHPLARFAKDAAAGAVLICAIASVAVGIALFFRPEILVSLSLSILLNPLRLILFVISFCASVLFVFKGGKEDSDDDMKGIDK